MEKKYRLILLFSFLLLLQFCTWFQFSNVPTWYKNVYIDSEYIYGKGRGTSRREELAIKKAETAAQSELSAQADIELRKIITQVMKSDGIDKNNPKSKRYQTVKKKVFLEIQQMVRIKKKKILHDNSIFSAFFLLELNKAELRKLYLYTLRNN